MTKQHFIAFAKQINDPELTLQEREVIARIVSSVARGYNPHFDKARFYKACGLEAD